MNREHFRAFLWLRWRLRVNQFRKAGTLNAVFFFVFVAFVLAASVGLFVTGFLVGWQALPGASATVKLLVWDGVICAFLFFWVMGLLADLQRAEGLALDKVLHLPVSPTGAFLINYLSSLFSLTLIAFLPGMVGLILGQVIAGSVAMLLALPLLAAFVLAVTGITYQFQGWLASLMANPRRRRTAIVFVTGGMILLAQLPNLLNLARPWEDGSISIQDQRLQDRAELDAKAISEEEYNRRVKERTEKAEERSRQKWERVGRIGRLASLVLPPGWLALGAADLADGAVLPALLGTLGLGAMGAVSLWGAYRTTVRLYTGAFTGQGLRKPAPTAVRTDSTRQSMLEWRLPWVSEHASAVAVATFRSLLRAPEAKMALLAPFMLLVMGGAGALSMKGALPGGMRPLMVFGAGTMVMILCGMHLIGNQFGFDRSGFRAYVLSPIPRREILLGKNMAASPLAIGLGLAVFLVAGTVFPMRVDHYPTVVVQLVSAYLLFCLLANVMSILAPIPLAAGAVQPSQVKMVPVLLQMAFMMVLPLVLGPVLIPLGAEILLDEFAEIRGMPVALGLSVLVLAASVFVYRRVLTWEGDWLAARTQAILETVTSKE